MLLGVSFNQAGTLVCLDQQRTSFNAGSGLAPGLCVWEGEKGRRREGEKERRREGEKERRREGEKVALLEVAAQWYNGSRVGA